MRRRLRELGIDQRFGEPSFLPAAATTAAAAAAAAAAAHHAGQHLQRRGIRMARRDRVIRDDHVLPLADAAQRHEPLAVLRRLHRVGLVEHARRARKLPHRVGDHLQRLRLVDPSR